MTAPTLTERAREVIARLPSRARRAIQATARDGVWRSGRADDWRTRRRLDRIGLTTCPRAGWCERDITDLGREAARLLAETDHG